jgi:hypothetical protein
MLERWGIQLSLLCRYYRYIRMLSPWVSATELDLDSQQNFPSSYPPWQILELTA